MVSKFKNTEMVAALEGLYQEYDRVLQGLQLACEPQCSRCCTVNVTATGLEIQYLLIKAREDGMVPNLQQRLLPVGGDQRQRYRPTFTINHAARCYLQGQDMPDDTGKHYAGKCPLLDQDGLCSVYRGRPFACRAMTSQARCRSGDEAVMPPFLVALNFVFYQLIEHVDADGQSGNLLDLLATEFDDNFGGDLLLTNQPLTKPVVDPAFRKPVAKFLAKMATRPVGEQTLANFLPLGP